jgi:hypothetical protein
MLRAKAAIVALFTLLAGHSETARLLYSDDFAHGLGQWSAELERGGVVEASGGSLRIDVPAGATVWFRPELRGPVRIEYDATMIQRGGPNDRVSDLNCFWMAIDARTPDDLFATGFATQRSGAFADYNRLRAYYVGQGGNGNTTTRFRRYIGDALLRPLLPEHDLSGPEVLLKANISQKIQIVADGGHIQYGRDGKVIFDFQDAAPYTHGWFGFRTTFSHLEVRHFRVYGLR